MSNNFKSYYKFDEIPLSEIKDSIIIVDGQLLLYQAMCGFRNEDGNYFVNLKGQVTSHVYGVYFKLLSWLKNNNKIIFCLDGKKIKEKLDLTVKKRYERTKKLEQKLANLQKSIIVSKQEIISIKKSIIKIGKELYPSLERALSLLGIQVVYAKAEAQSQCSQIYSELKKKGIHNLFILTPDSDILAFNGDSVIMNIKKDIAYVLNKKKSLDSLDLTLDQFIDCILLSGNDYHKGIPKIGPIISKRLISRYNSFLKIPQNLFRTDQLEVFKYLKENYLYFFNLFKNPPVFKEIDILDTPCDLVALEQFFVNELDFSRRILIPLLNILLKKNNQNLFEE